MTTVATEHLDLPGSDRQRRSLRARRDRIADRLAGRTVWNLGGTARAAAVARPDSTALGATPYDLVGAAPAGAVRDAPGGSASLGDRLRPGDIVVVHDGASAFASSAAREAGGEVLWQLPGLAGSSAAVTALALARRFTAQPDAYLVCWQERTARGTVEVETIAALVPAGDAVAAVRLRAPDDELRALGWQSILATCAELARTDHVGGVVHAKPTVAVR